MSYTRTTTINAAPGGDSVKQAVLDLDTDLTGAFTHLNTVQSDVDANQVVTDAHIVATAAHGATGAVVGTTSTQTLTNKTINLTSNTLTGTLAQFNTAVSDADILSTTTADSTYAPIAKGVTNGNSHDHSGGDGAQIAYSSLSGLPSLGTISSQAANNVTITGGTINNTAIGSTTPSTGAFTTLRATGAVQLATSTGNLLIGTTADDTTGIIQAAGKIASVGFPNANGAYNASGASILTGYPTFGWQQQLLVENANTNTYGWALSTTLSGTQSERVRVTGSGNLLIGTTTDDGIDKLQVNGSVRLGEDYCYSYIRGRRASTGLAIGTNSGSFDRNLKICQFDNNGDEVEVIATFVNQNGNLLVGTTTDDGVNKLQVYGTLSATTSGQFGQAVGRNVLIDVNSIQAKTGEAASSLYLQYTGGNICTNHNGGNFLIGTATDDGVNKLQVNGSISGVGAVTTRGPSGGFSCTRRDTDTYSFGLYSTSGGMLVDLPDVGAAMTIDASGNLIATVNGTAPTLSTNSTMSFELTSNTSFKIKVRGTDGVTRSTTLTLA